MPSVFFGHLSDVDLYHELERVENAVNTAQQLHAKWAKTLASVKGHLAAVQGEVAKRRLAPKPEAKVTDLVVGTIFEGTCRGEYFVMQVEGFGADHQAVLLKGQNEDDVMSSGWAMCDQIHVKRVMEVAV